MKRFIIIAAVCVLPLALQAEEQPETEAPMIEGLEDLAEGMRRLLEGFTDEMAPLMEDMAEQLKGLNAYHPPEVLPNGDIIIRRKTPDELESDDNSDADGAVDI